MHIYNYCFAVKNCCKDSAMEMMTNLLQSNLSLAITSQLKETACNIFVLRYRHSRRVSGITRSMKASALTQRTTGTHFTWMVTAEMPGIRWRTWHLINQKPSRMEWISPHTIQTTIIRISDHVLECLTQGFGLTIAFCHAWPALILRSILHGTHWLTMALKIRKSLEQPAWC